MERIEPFYIRKVFDDQYRYRRPDKAVKKDKKIKEDILRLTRVSDNGQTTIGRLYLNGKFLCHTCEDTRRRYELSQHDPLWEPKIKGKTCIVSGEFDLIDRRHGGFFNRYIKRFASIDHEGMVEVKDVLQFTDVLIHCGNTHRDTHGCILVGTKRNDDFVAASSATYRRVYPLIYNIVKYGKLKLIVTDVQDRLVV